MVLAQRSWGIDRKFKPLKDGSCGDGCGFRWLGNANMRSCGLILGLSLLALFLGATIFSIIIMGPIGIIAGPGLAIFGWFYLVPIFLLVCLASAIVNHPMFRGRGIYVFVEQRPESRGDV